MASNFVNTHPQFTVVTNGSFAPASDGEIEFFTVGNTGAGNRKDTYNVPNPSTPADPSEINPNPVPLDGYGRSTVPIFLQGSYNTVIRDSEGNQIDTSDNVSGFGGSGVSSIVVNNVTELAALDTDVYQAAYLLGTTTDSDGGQSWWYYDSGSVAADNGTTIIEPDVGSGRWLILQVATLGLKDLGVTSGKLAADSVIASKIASTAINFGLEWKTGLLISNNSGDATNDIDIAVGSIMDTNLAYRMNLTSAFTKRIDATFSAGTGNGGCASGNHPVANDTWLGIFLVSKSTNTSDSDIVFATTKALALASTGVTGVYDICRLIGYVRRGTAANLLILANGKDCKILDVMIENTTTASTAGVAVTVTVPPYQVGIIKYNILVSDNDTSATGSGILTQVAQTNTAPTSALSDAYAVAADSGAGASTLQGTDGVIKEVLVDSSSQIRHRETTDISGIHLGTIGFYVNPTVTDLV